MKTSTSRILTTHTGSLPRSEVMQTCCEPSKTSWS